MVAGPSKNTSFPANLWPKPSGLSIWEQAGWVQDPDAVVIGTGIVGMNAALELRSRHPDWHIVMADRSTFGGASTRNAGFACFGSPSELAEDWTSLGADALQELVEMRWSGLQSLRAMWGDKALSYSPCGAVEVFTDMEEFGRISAMLPEMNDMLAPILGCSPFQELSATEVTNRGIKNACGAISSPLEGALDTAAMVRAMRRRLTQERIEVIYGLQVDGLEPAQHGWHVHTTAGTVDSPRVFVCTNAWASSLLDVDVMPASNVVVVSQAMPLLKLNSTLHHDRGYVYARQVHGRLLIGGGRHWDCSDDTERTEKLIHWAKAHIKGAEDIQIEHHWVGQLGIGAQRMPLVRELKQGLFVGVRLGGMGVAIGTHVGKMLARLCP